MKVIIQKFGGTTVATPEKRETLVSRVKKAQEDGFSPVVVVSAMGRNGDPYATDTLKSLVESVCPPIDLREVDMIMSCGETISAVMVAATLNSKGIKARAMTGQQAGFVTDGRYSCAEVIECKPVRIKSSLENNEVVVVAGFQGAAPDGEINTIGRGGSDITAAVLGAALNVEFVEIYTDVNGVMTADPKVLKEARTIDRLTYSEVSQMAYEGAKVIHPSAVEVAMQNNVTIVIKNPADPDSGTIITGEVDAHRGEKCYSTRQKLVVTGIAHTMDIAQVQVNFKENDPDKELALFQEIAAAAINIDLISIFPLFKIFTVSEEAASKVEGKLEDLGLAFCIRRGCAKVSVVGLGMRNMPGVMARVIKALNEQQIEILQTGDSNITISLLIDRKDLSRAVKTLHDHFQLG